MMLAFVQCNLYNLTMQLTHIRTTDLNLLLAALVLFEERKISTAADRFHLSQPAMSRLLQRLRITFKDELLVRGHNGYVLTARARQLHASLAVLLPELDQLIAGPAFDAATTSDSFKIALTDYAALVIAPAITATLSQTSPGTILDFSSWSDNAFDNLERGKLDLAFWVETAPPPLLHETLFEDDFVCVVGIDHPVKGETLSLSQYLDFPHVIVGVLDGKQTIVEQRLEMQGIQRTMGLRVPFFAAAMLAVPTTLLIATVPRRLARVYDRNPTLRVLEPSISIGSFRYIMAWHPRVSSSPAHTWLRTTIKNATAYFA
jgi:DNA-binding transcriptional LysR family regulator